MQNTIGGGEWPLVGRAEELELLVKLRSRGLSAVISGPPGVGKSRLAGAALADAARHGWATLSSGEALGWPACRSGRCGPYSAFPAHRI
jgi:replication-associated recombination protein RarA